MLGYLLKVISRGCDSALFFNQPPPNNGCTTINGETWCFCTTLQNASPCNYLNQSAISSNNSSLITDTSNFTLISISIYSF